MKTRTMLTGHSFDDGVNHDQIIYDHLLECVRTKTPQQVLKRFQRLFIGLNEYDNQKVLNALAAIVNSKEAQYKFPLVLNRCCHILINRWQLQLSTQEYIPRLIQLFDSLPKNPGKTYSGSFYGRLQQLVINFAHSEHYKQLYRLVNVMGESKIKNSGNKKELIGNLINRYPYLYNHCLLSSDSSTEQQETVLKIKTQTQKKFEVDFSKYITYQVRVAQSRRNPELIRKSPKIIQPVSNPTLLSDKDLGISLKHYVGNVEHGRTYKDLSRSFVNHTSDIRNYQIFKDDLYEYIVQSVDPKYGKHHFNKKLYHKIQGIYPQHHQKKPDEFLKMRTYSQVFNYLIVESTQNPRHLVFMDLISNMGTTKTIGLFLKIALVCAKVKPYLEKRFSILFNHYESFSRDGALWLVRSLEKLNVGFTANFSNLDLSFLRKVYVR